MSIFTCFVNFKFVELYYLKNQNRNFDGFFTIKFERKILEELQLKKQMLLKQGVAPTLNTSLVTSTGSPSNLPSTQPSDGVAMSASQRAALHNAHAASSGYFVTQDSSFGNLILPVLPRFDTK
ncbi:SOSS complex subunit C isoform X1 [Apis laboriosa]|uniref:SOSS complex subunit C isoform X1 n=1 Tax=Apis laboriosa TaxID=183418 RepID=UPI001CC6C69E|nr:SOSS complex subunit C isoform X1 [Apis laboriosa]XP_043800296.1 SOSS complex subunit C isoform X1 [Apis laboriosa]